MKRSKEKMKRWREKMKRFKKGLMIICGSLAIFWGWVTTVVATCDWFGELFAVVWGISSGAALTMGLALYICRDEML